MFRSLLVLIFTSAQISHGFQSSLKYSSARFNDLTMSLYDYKLKDMNGIEQSLGKYSGKVVLIENVASLWGTTERDFLAMNEIAEMDPAKVKVAGVFCNQFGFQTNEKSDESLTILTQVRPGKGFIPKMDLYAKVNVNGAQADPLFKWMRSTIKIPQDPPGDTKENGCDDVDLIISPRSAFDGVTISAWSPVTRRYYAICIYYRQ